MEGSTGLPQVPVTRPSISVLRRVAVGISAIAFLLILFGGWLFAHYGTSGVVLAGASTAIVLGGICFLISYFEN